MRKVGLAAVVAASLAVTGCATYPNGYGYNPYYGNGYNSGYYNNGYYGTGYNGGYYGNGYNNGYYGTYSGRRYPYTNDQVARTVGGAAIGGIGGAILGRAIPGMSTGVGAVAGAILGGVIASRVNGRQYYRDTRGYCYYVDQYGQPHYNYNVRC